MERTLYHLHIKSTSVDFYYGSIKALIKGHDKSVLGVGIDTLYRIDWDNENYENDKIVIKKSELIASKNK